MALRLLRHLGQLGPSTGEAVEARGPRRGPSVDLRPYAALSIHADLDAIWRPGEPRARLVIRDSHWKGLRFEQSDQSLCVASSAPFAGERPLLELWGPQLERVELGAWASLEIQDAHAPFFLATCDEHSRLRVQGHARELHVECAGSASVDCASLVCEIAIAELSGDSFALLRAEAALQAQARDNCRLLTIGSPRILDVSREPK